MMKVLITGAAGMLANDVISELLNSGKKVFGEDISLIKGDRRCRLADIKEIDICNFEEMDAWVAMEKPDYVFHLAAETNVDVCEQNQEYAYRVNYIGTENCALICLRHNVKLLYISTAAVFDGKKQTPYTEDDETSPDRAANVYGRSKLLGEMAIARLLKKYFIVRAGWLMGGWELDKKFVYNIINQLRSGAKELRVVDDKFGSPTFTGDFAKNLLPLLASERYGIYNMVNKGAASRYEIALKIVEFMGCEGKVRVFPVKSDEFILPAPRPRSEMMRNLHLELIEMDHMPPWEESLKNYILLNAPGHD